MIAVADRGTPTFQEPEAIYWTAARVCHATGDAGNAHDYLARAWSIYRDRIAQIPDDASRAAYASLSFHRELEAAHEHGRWEAAVPVPARAAGTP